MPSQLSDDELMTQIASGNRNAFTQLLDRHGSAIFGYCMRTLSGNQAMAEDISQEVWLKVIKQAKRYEPRGHFKAWLMTIARNETVSQIRRQIPLSTQLDEAEEQSAQSEDQEDLEHKLAGLQESAAVVKAIEALPETQRIILSMWVNEDLSYEQMAEALGSTPAAVRSVLFRARRELRKKLERA